MFFSFKQDIVLFSLCSFMFNNICDPTLVASKFVMCCTETLQKKMFPYPRKVH